jgi:hypothetical protein
MFLQTSNLGEVSNKVVALIESFPWYVARHLHASKSVQFPTFNGQKSNW